MPWKECMWNLVTDTSWFNIYFYVLIISVCTFVSRIWHFSFSPMSPDIYFLTILEIIKLNILCFRTNHSWNCQLFPSRSLYALLFFPMLVFSLACFLHVSCLPTVREYHKLLSVHFLSFLHHLLSYFHTVSPGLYFQIFTLHSSCRIKPHFFKCPFILREA